MAKSVLTTPIEDIRRDVLLVPNGSLVDMIGVVYEMKWTMRDKMPDEHINMLERKESVIMMEMHRRRMFRKGTDDYQRFLNLRKKFFVRKVF